MKFKVSHTFPVSRTYYEENFFFDDDINELINEAVKIGHKTPQEVKEDDEIKYYKNLIRPQFELPAVMRKALKGKGVGYYEHTTYFKKENRVEWRIESEFFPDKITGQGEIKFVEVGDNKTDRVVTGEMHAKFFGVGKMIEKMLVDNITKSYNTIAEVTHTWLKENTEAKS